MSAVATKHESKSKQPSVLVVDDEPAMRELFTDIVAGGARCRVQSARTIAEARHLLRHNQYQLMIADVHLPDGDGMDLLEDLKLTSPAAAAIVMTQKPSIDGTLFALRHGVVDYLPKPFNAQQITQQVKTALRRQAIAERDDVRLTRLKTAVRELNKARHTVSQKVDLLCNDLVNAYGEVAQQLTDVRIGQSFKQTIDAAADLEQLLCHAMDWVLKEAGYCNIAIWLSGDNEVFDLGAYMKYTTAGEKQTTQALHDALVPLTAKEGSTHLSGEEFLAMLKPSEKKLLPNQTAMTVACNYLGETLAVFACFRDGKCPFKDEDAAMLKQIGGLFAVALATSTRGDAPDETDSNTLDEPKNESRKKPNKKDDAADWWKRGEAPPF
ncbi:MAG TPA: response regulator [Tepidisphaeraceae bacterium]|jgi:response regulator of citrate/malate metabolism